MDHHACTGGGGTIPVENPYVMGNAWFVDDIRFVENADEEIDALNVIDLRKEAVADKNTHMSWQDLNPHRPTHHQPFILLITIPIL